MNLLQSFRLLTPALLLVRSCTATVYYPPAVNTVAEVKTTFITLTKLCPTTSSITTTSSLEVQNTHIKYEPMVKHDTSTVVIEEKATAAYTPESEKHEMSTSIVVVQSIYTSTAIVYETSTTLVIVQNTHTPPPKHETTTVVVVKEHTVIYTPKVAEEKSTSTAAVIQNTYVPPVHETSTVEVEQKNTVIYTPKVEEYTTTSTYVVVQNTYIPPIHETSTTELEQKNTIIYTPKYQEKERPSNTHVVVQNTYTPPKPESTTTVAEQKSTIIYTPKVEGFEPSTTHIVAQNTYTSTAPKHESTVEKVEQQNTYLPSLNHETSTSVYVLQVTSASTSSHPPPTTLASKDTYTPNIKHNTYVSNSKTSVALPLQKDSLEAFSSLLNIILSIPEKILTEGDEAVATFFNDLSTCLTTKGGALKESLEDFKPVVDEVGDKIEEGAKKAGDFIGGLVGGIKGLFSRSSSTEVHENVSMSSRTTSISNSDTPSIGEVLTNLDALRACLSSSITTNPIFEVGKCALSIGSVAFPAARLLRARRAVTAVNGGVKRILEILSTVKSVGELIDRNANGEGIDGGKVILDVLGELTGIGDIVRDCRFIVE